MHRIYFDTNEGAANHDGYGLWLDASEADLARIPGGPRNEMEVIIYMTGELEIKVVPAFDPDQNVRTARPVSGTTIYVTPEDFLEAPHTRHRR